MKLRQGKQPALVMVVAALLLAILACSGTPASSLNEGRGTRNDPVPARRYTRTTEYEVRVLTVVRPSPPDAEATAEPSELTHRYHVQFQVKCRKPPDDICDLDAISDQLKLVSSDGIIYEPMTNPPLEESDTELEGRILGGAEKTGWMVYEAPTGVELSLAMAEYGQDRRAFFRLP